MTMDPLRILIKALEQVYGIKFISLVLSGLHLVLAAFTSYIFIVHSFAFPSTMVMSTPMKDSATTEFIDH